MFFKKKNPQQETPLSRVNYEDHSLKFLDWVDQLGFEKTILGRWLVLLEEKFYARRFGAVFIFSLILAYAITFEINTPMNFQIGDVVKFDVTSPVSFEMVDEVTTEEKRVRSELAIPVILDYDPLVHERVTSSILRAFRLMRLEQKKIVWPKSVNEQEEKVKDFYIHKGEFEKTLGVPVSDLIFEWLVRIKFNARVENLIVKNLEIWYESKIAENLDRILPNTQMMVLARTISKNNQGREFNLKRIEILDTINLEGMSLSSRGGMEGLTASDRNYILALSKSLLFPNLTLNKQEVASRRQLARDSVLPITLSIKKNQIILPAGTVIQPFHMAMLKEIESLRSDRRHDIIAVAMAIIFLVIILIFFQYLRRFVKHKIVVASKDLWVMGTVTLLMIVSVKLVMFLTETAFMTKFGSAIPHNFFLYLMPVALAPMLVGLLIQAGEVVWLFTAFIALALGFMTEMNFEFVLVTLGGGIAAARGVYNCKKRNDIYIAGMRTGLFNAIIIALLTIINHLDQPGFLKELLFTVPAGFLSGIFSSMGALMIIPVLESAFQYTTDVKLLELSNLNHPLLKEMIVRAPGTYHHSMLVGSMVEAASEDIGANPLLGKVMCYYHDIGKMEHANYFIENQKPGQNPHDHISPYMSKTLLVAHVKDGVELGITHKLGKPIIDGIIQHHGTTLISFFYNKALDLKTDDDADVSEEDFRYPGPKPQFREAALCMLADSIEAASRSLDEPTPVRLQNIVRNIVQRKFMEGQLDECSLTLKDLSKVEQAFTRILLGIYHQRIDYPKAAGGGASEAPKAFFTSGN